MYVCMYVCVIVLGRQSHVASLVSIAKPVKAPQQEDKGGEEMDLSGKAEKNKLFDIL